MPKKPPLLARLSPETRQRILRVGTCCAYASLICGTICVLFTARSRWAIPLIILFLICNVLGRFSFTHQHVTRASEWLFPILFNLLMLSAFNDFQQVSELALVQQQQRALVQQIFVLQDEQPLYTPSSPQSFVDTSTGYAVLQPRQWIAYKYLLRRYPLQLDVAVDHFIGYVTAEAEMPDVDRFQRLRGPGALAVLHRMLQAITPFVIWLWTYLALVVCSYSFFDGLEFNRQVVWHMSVQDTLIWGFLICSGLKLTAFIIGRLIIVPQKIKAQNPSMWTPTVASVTGVQ